MLTDIFETRYPTLKLRDRYFEDDRRLMHQVARLIVAPLWGCSATGKGNSFVEESLKVVHDRIATEYGQDWLSDRFSYFQWGANKEFTGTNTHNYATICKNYLEKIPGTHADPDASFQNNAHIIARLSFIEQAFQHRFYQVQASNVDLSAAISRASTVDATSLSVGRMRVPGKNVDRVKAQNEQMNLQFDSCINELNQRIKRIGYGLTFHNGYIQKAEDELIESQITRPFWNLVVDSKWHNVSVQMSESIDGRDRGDRDAISPAMKALESCIKIISDEKGWTKGNERGAANYIDNLVAEREGTRFVSVWEMEALKKFFSDVRNEFGHGPGNEKPVPRFLPQQTDWAIETAMTWTKSLIKRH